MPKKLNPEAKLIELFENVTLQRAEILLGVAKALVARKRRIFSQPVKIEKPDEQKTA